MLVKEMYALDNNIWKEIASQLVDTWGFFPE